jgi:SsrA-binding protein
MEKKRFSKDINIRNKQANFEFSIIDTYVAGIILQGTEIKSIREGKVTLQDGYCYINNGELFVKSINISPYTQGTHYNHEPTRERKLLLKKAEIRKIESKMKEKGLTLIPLRLFLNPRGFAKLEIALAKGKKQFDKRESIKARDVKRELDRMKL